MKWALLLFSQSILAGCGQSKPESSLIKPHRVYVEPQPIHHSVVRTRKSSASHSDSEKENEMETMRLRTAIRMIREHYERQEEKKQQEQPETKADQLLRASSSNLGALLD